MDSLLTFNNTQKLLAGALALVLVAGLGTPAFAGVAEPFCEITQNQMVNVDIALGEQLEIPKTFQCNQLMFQVVAVQNLDDCINIGVLINFLNPSLSNGDRTLDFTESLFNSALGDNEGHCEITFEAVLASGDRIPITQELWFNVPEEQQVAGELLPLNTSALVIAGLTSMSIWMVPTVLGLAGVGVYLVKFRKQ